MVYVHEVKGARYPSTDVICFLDEHMLPTEVIVNTRKMIDRTIKGKVEDLLAIAGIGWERAMGAKDLRKVFG